VGPLSPLAGLLIGALNLSIQIVAFLRRYLPTLVSRSQLEKQEALRARAKERRAELSTLPAIAARLAGQL
jgi:hypothetical protein